MLVFTLVKTPLALGTMAPVVSFTVPLSWAVTSAPNAEQIASMTAIANKREATRNELTVELLRMTHLWNQFFLSERSCSLREILFLKLCYEKMNATQIKTRPV